MRLRSISLRGITRYRSAEPVTVDFDALGPGLVALVGRKGAGKSTLAEAAPATLYKAMPTRPGSLYDRCYGRDAFVESTWEDDGGHEIKVRVQIDAERRTTEGYIFLDGVSLTTGRAAEFDAEVLKRFGSEALFLASVFAAQDKAGNFISMKKGDRKSIFLEMIQAAHLELRCAVAREKARDLEADLSSRRSVIAAGEIETAGIEVAEFELDEIMARAGAAEITLNNVREAEAEASRQLGLAKSAADRIAPLEAALAAATREMNSATTALSEAEARLAQLVTIRDERLRFIASRKVDDLEPAARKRHADTTAGIEKRRVALEAQIAAAPDGAAAQSELNGLATERRTLENGAALLEAARREELSTKNALAAATKVHDAAVKARDAEIARLTRQAGLVAEVPCGEWPTWGGINPEGNPGGDLDVAIETTSDLAGTCPLLADARKARAALTTVEAPVDESELATAHRKHAAAAEVLAGYLPEEQPRVERLKAIGERETALRNDIAAAKAVEHAKRQLEALAGEMTTAAAKLEEELTAWMAAVEQAATDRDLAEHEHRVSMQEAATKIAAARTAATVASGRKEAADTALSEARAQLGDAGVAAAVRDLALAEVARKTAEAQLRTADQAVATARARLDALRATEARLEGLRTQVAAVARDLGDWRLLEAALGRDGIQALEVDAAGPEVAAIANDILTACSGSRFSLTFETTRAKKTKGKEDEVVEAFDVQVFDEGQPRPIEDLSGGEKAIVGEALSLALSIFNARKNAIRHRTLFRDETAGSLDPESADEYVRMLRRARELGGFAQVIFIAHLPQVYEAADVQLHVADGRVTVGRAA